MARWERRQFRNPDGTPDLRFGVVVPIAETAVPLAPGVGVKIIRTEDVAMAQQKAPGHGVYTLDGNRFIAREGALMPDGAEFEAVEDETDEEREAERAKAPASENRMNAAANENRGKKS